MSDIIHFDDYADSVETVQTPATPEPETPAAKVKAFHDFDNFWSEKEREVLKIRIFGEEHELPASVPAQIVLGILRMQQQGIAAVPEEQVLTMTESIFGKARLDSWCDKGLTIEQMGDLLSWALDQYQSQKPMGNPTLPARAKRGRVRR